MSAFTIGRRIAVTLFLANMALVFASRVILKAPDIAVLFRLPIKAFTAPILIVIDRVAHKSGNSTVASNP